MSVLVQRSVLGKSGYPLDQIHIRGIAARGYHGVLQSERDAGQDFSADVTLYLDTRAAARGDDLAETVNYALVAEDVHAILSGDPVNLVETVAERIADAVLTRPQVISVDVTVHKPQAPIPLPFDDVVVTIHRDRVNVPVASAPVDGDAAHEDDAAPTADGTSTEPADDRSAAPPAPVAGRDRLVQPLPPPPPLPVPAAAPGPMALRVQQVRPVVISRTATDQLPVVSAPDVAEPAVAAPVAAAPVAVEPRSAEPLAAESRSAEPLTAEPSAVEAHAAEPLAGDHRAPEGEPVDHLGQTDAAEHADVARSEPGLDETTHLPRQTTPPAGERIRPPTAEEIAILEEQARISAARRRPEVFGTARVTAGTRPDVVLDQTVVFAPVPAHDPDPVQATHGADTLEPLEPFAPVDALETPAPVDEHGTSAGEPSPSETTAHLEPVEMLDRMDARPSEPVDVVIALGGNLGEPQETLRQAVAELGSLVGTELVAVGPLARTAAVGGPDQPDFLNTVVLARTTSSARELLHACQRIEQAHGRERIERWGPRTLDVDIIVYDGLIDSADDLELPHPRAHERSFVLAPWAHVDPDAILPGLGGGPVGALAATAPDREGIRWLALDWLHDSDAPSEARRAGPPSIAPQHTGSTPAHGEDTNRPGPSEASTLSE